MNVGSGLVAIVTALVIVVVFAFGLPVIQSLTGNVYTIDDAVAYLEGKGYIVAAEGEGYNSDFFPNIGSAYDLGTETKYWDNLYADTAYLNELDAPTGRTATYVVAASDASSHVKAQADYVCDGTADDVEIQAAIDALPTGAGTVHLSSGTFHVSAPIKPRASLIFEGEGVNSTILQLIDGADCNIIEDVSDFASNKLWLTIQDMLITGNRDNNSAGNGIYLNSVGAGHYWEVRIIRCEVGGCVNDGINISSAHGMLISHTPVESVGGSAIVVGGGDYGAIEYCTIKAVGAVGINVESTTNVKVIGNEISSITGVPLRVGKGTVATANRIGSSGTTTAVALSTRDNVILIGNNIYAETYYFSIASGGNDSIITDNYMYGGGTGSNYGSNNMIKDNIGYIAPGELRTASGSLTAGNANAIAFAWENPEAQDIYVKKVVVTVTTPGGTVGSHLDVGIADNAAGTNRGTEFFDDLLLNTAQVNDSTLVADGGTQSKWVLCEDSASATDGWVVGQILVENAASLAGSYYIEYVGK